MANTSRKKTLPLAVLAAPALAFGSLTFAAAPATAVPADEVETLFAEDGIDTILVYATEEVTIYRDGQPDGTHPAGSPLFVPDYDEEQEQFIGYDGARYDIEPFAHATADQYRAEDLDVPAFIEELEEDDATETVSLSISLDVTEAQVGDTVRITIDNLQEVLASHNPADYNLEVDGDVAEGDFIGRFGDAGIEQVGDDEETYEFTIPETIATDAGDHEVGAGSSFSFWVTITMNPDAEVYLDTSSSPVTVNVTADDTQDDGDDADAGDEDNANPDNDDENPEDADENGNEGDQGGTPGNEGPVEAALSVESDEILVEDFVGDPEEGAGVIHNLTGMAPNTTFEYEVETPANIQPFSSSVLSDENGAAEFSIYGENADNPSVYIGDYTTTVTYEDEDGETQELTTSFSVVEASNDNGDVGGEEDDEVTPVVDTEEPAEPVADTDNDQDEAAPAPAVGGADAQLADTGANGAPLMWIAGGLLALGGAFVIYANRGRLFGRKN